MEKIRKAKLDIIVVILLVVAGLKLTFGIERIIDIGLFDESGYLYGGVSFLQKGLFPAAWSPLYALWYFFLSLFESDRIALYYLNYKILTILPAILLYILMRSYKISIPIAVFVSWMFLISMANLYVWPKPSHLALIIILTFLLIVRVPESYIRAVPMLAIGALLGSYVRPEFFLSFVLFVLSYIFIIAINFKKIQIKSEIAPVVTLAGISLLLMSVFGIPVWDKQGGRSFEAFSQHFSVNWVYWTGSQLDPWVDYHDIMSTNFGNASSIYGALSNNYWLVLKHILYNIVNYVASVIEMPFLHFNVIFPGSNKLFTWIEGAIFGAVIVVYIVLRRKSIFVNRYENIRKYRFVLISFAILCIPAVISSVIIYPESHYLITQVILVSVALAVIASGGSGLKDLSLVNIAVMLVFMVVATPYMSTNWYFSAQGRPQEVDLNNLHTIEYIKSLNIRQDVNLLEADGGYYIYVGDNFHRIPQTNKDVDFTTFIRRTNIDMIVVSDEMRNDKRYREDHEWAFFLENYRSFGYEAVDIPGTDRELITRTAFLGLAEDQKHALRNLP